MKELDNTSSCVVELHWQSENKKSIDLLFVLSVCFVIHDDTRAGRYSLQCYNCYFVLWAIIEITMWKSVVCGAVLKQDILKQQDMVRSVGWALVQGVVQGPEGLHDLWQELWGEPVREQEQEREQTLA